MRNEKEDPGIALRRKDSSFPTQTPNTTTQAQPNNPAFFSRRNSEQPSSLARAFQAMAHSTR